MYQGGYGASAVIDDTQIISYPTAVSVISHDLNHGQYDGGICLGSEAKGIAWKLHAGYDSFVSGMGCSSLISQAECEKYEANANWKNR